MSDPKHILCVLRVSLLSSACISAFCAPVVVAQEEQSEGTDRIEVVGSLIPRQDLTGPSPVAVFDEVTIEQSGVVSLGQLLREIPSVAGQGQAPSVNNGGTGQQQISLRGLGSERTLVLINGRRVPDSGADLTGQADLSTIPVSMVKRVEVLKDGASTVYGSDAVSGVVNIVLKDDFQGVEFGYQTGISGEGDARRNDYYLTFGQSSDKGNFIVNFSKTEEDGITAGDREFSEFATDLIGGEIVPGGSSAPPWGRYFVPQRDGQGAFLLDDDGNVVEEDFTLGPDFTGGDVAGFREFNFADDAYNFAPINNQTLPVERWSFTAIGRHEFAPLTDTGPFVSTEVFGEVSYIDRESTIALAEVPLAPFAFFGFDAPYSADNAFNPFGEDVNDWRRRVVETGPRTDALNVTTTRMVAGFEGELVGGWDWQFSYAYGDVLRTSAFFPIINLNNVAEAVGPTALDGDGVLRCDTSGDGVFSDADNGDCVPLDVFSENSITTDMLDFISITQNERTEATSEIYSFDLVNPSLFQAPGGDVGVAFGLVRREERGKFIPDSQVAALGGAATGTPAQGTDGGYDLDEVFAEIRVPVIEQIEVEAGVRYSDYSTFGNTTNYKVGVTFRPVEQVLLRGSFNTAFRAPQIDDLFGGQAFSFPSETDPCADDPTQFCIDDGVPANGFTQVSSQVRTLVGGSPDVQPEESENFTVGGIWTPDGSLSGFAIGLDYFSYEITDAITTIGAGTILDQCAATGEFCDLIERITTPGASFGAPILVTNLTTNVGSIEASGIDYFVEWSGIEDPFLGGVLDLKFDGTYYDTYDLTQANGTITPHAGFFRDDDEGHFAEWRWSLGANYAIGDLTVYTQARYIGEVEEFNGDLFGRPCADDAGVVTAPGVNFGLTCVSDLDADEFGEYQRTIEAVTYFDFYASYDLDLFGGDNQVYFGVDNIADEQPPYSTDGFNDNTDVRTYDTLGRYFYAGFRTAF